MFTNFYTSEYFDHPHPSEALIETLESVGFFDAFGEIDLSVASETSFTDASFLDSDAPISTLRKRFLAEANNEDSSEIPPTEDPVALPPNVHEKKPRKPSHVVVKEAREQLLAQVRHLEIQVLLLRQETGVADSKVEEAKKALNLDLREAVLQYDLQVASTQSVFSGYANSRATSPLETYIHLGTDWGQRRSVLVDMKDRKIEAAQRFLLERTRHTNPLAPSCEVSKFETEQGEVYAVRVDVTPFEGVKSVCEVFEALQFYFANMAITKTELSGKATICENEATNDDSAMQHRIVTFEGLEFVQESNLIVFYDTSSLNAVNADDQRVVMAGDFVDRDDLFPYRPSERLRKDVTSVMKLSAHRRRQSQGISSETDEELVVAFTRVFFVRLHRPQFDVPKQVLQSIADDMTDSIDVMLKSMQERLRPMKQEWI